MVWPFVSLILLCAGLAAFSANTKAQELVPQEVVPQEVFKQLDAHRREIKALRRNAANQANPQAVLKLAKALYLNGQQMRNHREACSIFEKASVRGSAEATAWLGSCYIYGKGVEKRDNARGVSLIKAAAQSDDATGLQFLGILYERGNGVARDFSRAAELYSKAVSKGYAPAYARLGSLYLRGLGVEQNRPMAFALFNRGSRMGDHQSQFLLGELAFRGFVGPQGELLGQRSSSPNYEMALQLFSQAAAQGNDAAAFNVAQMYEHQLGVARDTEKAAAYYIQSARAGNPRAQLALGQFSEKRGRGPLNAYAWYSLAISQGNGMAKGYLDALRAKMTPDQVQQAEAILKRWNANHFCYGCM
jgi:TPR repeat protein